MKLSLFVKILTLHLTRFLRKPYRAGYTTPAQFPMPSYPIIL